MESFNSAHAFGLSLVDQGHFAAEEIQENCEEMNLVRDELMESWDEKQIELSQSYELQVWHLFMSSLRSCCLLVTWLEMLPDYVTLWVAWSVAWRRNAFNNLKCCVMFK